MSFKRPESVLVLIYTRDGDVLLMERRHPQGFWQSVTGSLNKGEQPAEAAVREVREETGLDVGERITDCGYANRFPILPQWRGRYDPGVHWNLEHVFRVEYSARPAVHIEYSEHRRFIWLPLAEALTRVSSSTNRDAIERYVSG